MRSTWCLIELRGLDRFEARKQVVEQITSEGWR